MIGVGLALSAFAVELFLAGAVLVFWTVRDNHRLAVRDRRQIRGRR